ncbi:NAD(P)H-binding protein [Actinoplanes sp. NPDC051851]|uniref:SDR family oxidoreductase n=1 Tax=Actinoplanes sp. NPDC051851 TaxID=3154753 RepID=UPI00342F451D
MRIAVAGGTGWIGRLVVAQAREAGHDVVVIARSVGVDLTTGAGLDAALKDVDAVIDVSNIETLRRATATRFFETVTRTLLAAEERAGVKHHVLLSIVGVDRVPWGYYQAKLHQEEIALAGAVPVTVLRATQFHEFAAQMLERSSGPIAVVPRMLSRPVAAAEVAAELIHLAASAPLGRAPDLAGPETLRMADLVRTLSRHRGLRKLVLEIPLPGPAGRAMSTGGILPATPGSRGTQTFTEWLTA